MRLIIKTPAGPAQRPTATYMTFGSKGTLSLTQGAIALLGAVAGAYLLFAEDADAPGTWYAGVTAETVPEGNELRQPKGSKKSLTTDGRGVAAMLSIPIGGTLRVAVLNKPVEAEGVAFFPMVLARPEVETSAPSAPSPGPVTTPAPAPIPTPAPATTPAPVEVDGESTDTLTITITRGAQGVNVPRATMDALDLEGGSSLAIHAGSSAFVTVYPDGDENAAKLSIYTAGIGQTSLRKEVRFNLLGLWPALAQTSQRFALRPLVGSPNSFMLATLGLAGKEGAGV